MSQTANLFSGPSLARSALEISPSAIVVADDSGTILFANPTAEHWFGYACSEITGSAIQGLVPEFEVRAPHAQGACRLSHSVCPSDKACRKRVICKDGSEVDVCVTLVSVCDQTEPLILANFDKLDRQKIDGGVVELERLDAIATMISGLAHESRNALQRAVACLDLMELDLKDDARQLELSEKIRRSLSDLLDNYDEVRRFAEPITLSRSRQRLLPLCAEAYEQVVRQRDVNDSQLVIREATSSDDRAVFDGGKIREVFRHVISNAVDQPGPIKIEVECCDLQCEGNDAIGICLLNDGAPFGEESLRRAFEPFYTTKQHGTGLGLSISQRFVRAHGGSIQVGDPTAGGALVRIVLPKIPSNGGSGPSD